MCAEAQLENGDIGAAICPAFVLQLHRHQAALPHEFDNTSSIRQVKGRLEVIVEEAPILDDHRIALRPVTLPSQARPGSQAELLAFAANSLFWGLHVLHSGQVVTRRE
jgi:hypothetical protein